MKSSGVAEELRGGCKSSGGAEELRRDLCGACVVVCDAL